MRWLFASVFVIAVATLAAFAIWRFNGDDGSNGSQRDAVSGEAERRYGSCVQSIARTEARIHKNAQKRIHSAYLLRLSDASKEAAADYAEAVRSARADERKFLSGLQPCSRPTRVEYVGDDKWVVLFTNGRPFGDFCIVLDASDTSKVVQVDSSEGSACAA